MSDQVEHQIIVRFPTKEMADYWCGQMSDGLGEDWCGFSFWRQIAGTDGLKAEHYEKITSSAPDGTEVYFVKWVQDFGNDQDADEFDF